jgi:hypothetical protein
VFKEPFRILQAPTQSVVPQVYTRAEGQDTRDERLCEWINFASFSQSSNVSHAQARGELSEIVALFGQNANID